MIIIPGITIIGLMLPSWFHKKREHSPTGEKKKRRPKVYKGKTYRKPYS